MSSRWMWLRVAFVLALGIALSAAPARAETVWFLPLEDCHNGVGHFREAFKKYFEGAGEKYLKMGEDDLRALMTKDTRERFELDLVATPALPENYAGRLSKISCWSQLYDFAEKLHAGKTEDAASFLAEWRRCAERLYRQQPGALELVGQVDECFENARKSGVIPKTLPAEAKKPPVSP